MTISIEPGVSRVSQSVSALKAWHHLNVEDVAAAMNVSLATAARRLKDGGYRYDEVRSLAAYFGVTIEALETGQVSLPESTVAKGYGWNHKRGANISADWFPSRAVAA